MSSPLSLASITLQLKQQYAAQLEMFRNAEEKGALESVELRQALQETRNLLARLGHDQLGSHNISSSIPFGLQDGNDSLEPSIKNKLLRDVQNLSLQLRCNLVTEDRPHMGRIYLQSFVGEDAISWLEKRAEIDRIELLGKGTHSSQPDEILHRESPSSTPESSPSSSRSASPSPSRSPRGNRRRRGGIGIGRMEALWVANELVRSGEWQQLTGAALGPDKRVEKATTSLMEAASVSGGTGPLHSSAAAFTSPTGRIYHPHNSLFQFTLFRMRTWPALNEQYNWECIVARDAEAVTCHLLALVSELQLDELGEGMLSSRRFQRFERATAELQRVEYAGLGSAGLTSFLVNLHNIMVRFARPLPTHNLRRPPRSSVTPPPPLPQPPAFSALSSCTFGLLSSFRSPTHFVSKNSDQDAVLPDYQQPMRYPPGKSAKWYLYLID